MTITVKIGVRYELLRGCLEATLVSSSHREWVIVEVCPKLLRFQPRKPLSKGRTISVVAREEFGVGMVVVVVLGTHLPRLEHP